MNGKPNISRGLSKQPEFEKKWYQPLSPEVREDYEDYNSGCIRHMDIRSDYEAMVEYLDYIDSGRKYPWQR